MINPDVDYCNENNRGNCHTTITQEEYEKKWYQRFHTNAPENVVGYGPDNRYIPPLFNPDWMLSIFERHTLLTFSFPLLEISGTFTSLVNGLGNGDTYDGYFYNSAGAAGS